MSDPIDLDAIERQAREFVGVNTAHGYALRGVDAMVARLAADVLALVATLRGEREDHLDEMGQIGIQGAAMVREVAARAEAAEARVKALEAEVARWRAPWADDEVEAAYRAYAATCGAHRPGLRAALDAARERREKGAR